LDGFGHLMLQRAATDRGTFWGGDTLEGIVMSMGRSGETT
jgi:hypothetical protein